MNTANLLMIAAEARVIENMLIESGGEITPEIENKLAARDVQLPEKVDSYQATIERFDMLAEYHKAKAAQQAAIAKQCDLISKKLKENVEQAMDTLKVDEILGNETRFARVIKKDAAVDIENEDEVEAGYKTQVIEWKIDKKRILEDLKQGPVAGAKLRDVSYVQAFPINPATLKKTKKGKS